MKNKRHVQLSDFYSYLTPEEVALRRSNPELFCYNCGEQMTEHGKEPPDSICWYCKILNYGSSYEKRKFRSVMAECDNFDDMDVELYKLAKEWGYIRAE